MASAYDRIKAAIQAAADGASDLLQTVLLGTPGSQVVYPSDSVEDEDVAQTVDTGGYWDGQFLPPVLQQVGAELDQALNIGSVAWAFINTGGAGGSPTVANSGRVSGATKNEPSDYIEVTFDPGFDSAAYFVSANVFGPFSLAYDKIIVMSSNTVQIQMIDPSTMLAMDINNLSIMVLACGNAPP